MQPIRLKLFVAGNTIRSQRARANLEAIRREDWADRRVDLTVVDVLTQPDLADDARILATPTLVKEYPLPVRRIVGDLCDIEQVLRGLGLGSREKSGGLHLWIQEPAPGAGVQQVG
jgi:circadian clock protein KaiB